MRSKPFLVLYLSVLVATMGISMVSPLLPVYAKEFGATGIWIGITFSIFAVTQTLTSPFVGGWSDRYGRKPFIITGLLLYTAAAIGYLLADELWQVIAFRALSGGGTSLIFSVAHAYLGDMMPEGQEGRWSGIFSSADIIGFGIGPLLAGVVRQTLGFDSVFVGMALLMGTSATVVMLLLPARLAASTNERAARVLPSSPLRLALRDRMVLALTLNWALISLSFASTFSFLGVRLERLEVGAALIGVVFSLESVSSGLSQPFFGILADRLNRRLLNVIGLILLAVLVSSLGITERLPVIAAIMLGVGAAGGIAVVSTNAMQVDVGRRIGMGTVIGLGSAGMGTGVLFGSLMGGLLVDITGHDVTAFFFAGGSMLIGSFAFLWLSRGALSASAPLNRSAAVFDQLNIPAEERSSED
jgi:DHA1 family multidrug resistance protein-like MFS transporter